MRNNNNKIIKKTDLPSKICIQCQRPFSWRKKWERSWEEVKFCSEACKKGLKLAKLTIT